MSVDLLVVRLFYRLYVCVHLSKWFTFFYFSVRYFLSGRCLLRLHTTFLYPPRYGAYLPNSGRLCAINVASNFFHKILFPAYKVSKGEIFFCRRQSCSATNALWRDASYRFKYHPPRKNLHQRQEKISPSLFNCRI
jgi:hypothetical protein